ncbi:MAG: hypothetical protein R2932_39230 [Caldilineaceae bacterium]
MRTRIVVFFTLLIGLTSLWIVLFGLSPFWLQCMFLPVCRKPGSVGRLGWVQRHAAFMATLGVLAGVAQRGQIWKKKMK